jgi:hypothetical protein
MMLRENVTAASREFFFFSFWLVVSHPTYRTEHTVKREEAFAASSKFILRGGQ